MRVEPSVLDSSYVRDENVEEDVEEEDRQSLVRYKENINQAERTPFDKVMTQRTETMTREDIEDRELQAALDDNSVILQDIIARRRQDDESFPISTPSRIKNTVMTRSRRASVDRDGARARPRLVSLSSNGTGYGYDSGPETDGDYQSAEESAPPPGKSIMVPQPRKIDLDCFTPSGMENFKKICKLVSDGNQLEDKV